MDILRPMLYLIYSKTCIVLGLQICSPLFQSPRSVFSLFLYISAWQVETKKVTEWFLVNGDVKSLER